MNKIITSILLILLISSVLVSLYLYSGSNKPNFNGKEATESEYLKLKESADELQKLNLDIYFKVNTPVNDVNALRTIIKDKHKDVSIEYISQEQALYSFREANRDDEIAMQALEVVGENPFGAILKIKTSSPEETKQIADYVESVDSAEVVDKMNYKVH